MNACPSGLCVPPHNFIGDSPSRVNLGLRIVNQSHFNEGYCPMKLAILMFAAALLLPMAQGAQAHDLVTPATPQISTPGPEHGGGCRKDSPRGQCCHAGSKPYHCH
jgi:hypothetical protein